jgi:diguanylate cyclase (GGDEF)-like protein
MVAWIAGDLVWQIAYSGLEVAPYPSISDALYLLFYPGAYGALILLLRRRAQGLGAGVWLDGIAGACAAAAVGAALLLPVLLAAGEGSTATVATNLAYPLADLLLGGFVVLGCAIAHWRPERALVLLAAALVVLGTGDGVYLYTVSVGTYVEGTLLDALWPAGMVLAGLAAWQRPERRRIGRQAGTRLALGMPTLITLTALALLIYGNVRSLGTPALVLATIALLAAAGRAVLAFREVRVLAVTRKQAITDELTGLANRRRLGERMDDMVAAARATGRPLAFLLIDLDGFKELNDTLGHKAGDMLLRQIGPRLAEGLREQDLLARLGGDEFGVLLPDTGPEAALAVGQRLRAQLETPFGIEGLMLAVDASAGAAVFPDHGRDADALVQRADVAMYQAKSARTGTELYDAGRDMHSRDRLAMVSELRRGIEEGQLVVHYQPKATLEERQITGVEALVRWNHPERGILLPADFLAYAEQTDLMRPLTLHVIDQALGQCAAWADEGLELSVAVNLGQVNLIDRQLPGDVAAALERWGVPAERLHLEITENLVMADPRRTMEVLGALRALGVGLSLDDFGTGQTSLAYLRKLSLDEIKIDRSFVLELGRDEDAAAIVRSTVQMAQALRLRVVAEGAEDAAAMRRLREFGCELVQGFFLSPPLPAAEITDWLRAQSSASAEADRAADADALRHLAAEHQ